MNINSEITKLRKVLLHKPALALYHLTPENCHELLFDDIVWVEKADEEHDCFEIILQHNGVQIFILHELLADTLQISAAKEWLLEKRLSQLHDESRLKHEIFTYLNQLKTKTLAAYLLGGITLKQSGLMSDSLTAKTSLPNDFLIPPLPNHLYTRDTSCWIGEGVSINSMHYSARRGETYNLAAIYKFHPFFTDQNPPIWYDGSEKTTLPSIEGGDVLVLTQQALLIGVSERTSPQAIEMLARNLFTAGNKQQIICVELPKKRASMHLDTMMTLVSRDTFVTAFLPDKKIRSWTVRPGDNPSELVVETNKDFYVTLAQAMRVDSLNIIVSSGDFFIAQREQWTDSANLLAIAPGEVIAYDRNVEMNKKLRLEGITVHEIPGSELSRGRGGPRCMSCPLERG